MSGYTPNKYLFGVTRQNMAPISKLHSKQVIYCKLQGKHSILCLPTGETSHRFLGYVSCSGAKFRTLETMTKPYTARGTADSRQAIKYARLARPQQEVP